LGFRIGRRKLRDGVDLREAARRGGAEITLVAREFLGDLALSVARHGGLAKDLLKIFGRLLHLVEIGRPESREEILFGPAHHQHRRIEMRVRVADVRHRAAAEQLLDAVNGAAQPALQSAVLVEAHGMRNLRDSRELIGIASDLRDGAIHRGLVLRVDQAA
jgi:hypothetical protein